MAYDKIIVIRRRLDNCINYAVNEAKSGHLVTGINCEPETAFLEMQGTKGRWDKRGGNLGYHIIHSYAPGEATSEQAHAAGVEFAQRLLGDRYEVVVATHADREHLHCHIVFNSVSLVDGKRYRNDFKAYFGDIRETSNEVSREHGLSVIEPDGRGKHYAEWDAERRGKPTVRGMIRDDIDAIVSKSYSYKSFLSQLRQAGYEVKTEVKHTAVKPPGGSRFVRLASLGEGYTEGDIKSRLSYQRQAPPQVERPVVPAYYRVTRGKPRKRKPARKGSLQALYLYYRYLLSPSKQKRARAVPFDTRAELRRLERYRRQFLLLHQYHIESRAELSMLSDALQAEIDVLVAERKQLYRQRRQEPSVRINEAVETLNSRLRTLRWEMRLCWQIDGDSQHIQEQVRTARRQKIETPQRGRERSDTRWM